MTFYLGTMPTWRSQFIFPLVICGNILIAITSFRYSLKLITRLKTIVIISCFVLVMNQFNLVKQLWYTEEIRAQEDIRLATQII